MQTEPGVDDVNERRPMGSLEASVMDRLWRAKGPMTPAAVQAELGDDLAYTTVMTILTRLWKKNLVLRQRVGRAFEYSPAITEADFLSDKMRTELARTKDRQAVLSRFGDKLSAKDARALRDVLRDLDAD